jgi:uncharacterized protein YcfJ
MFAQRNFVSTPSVWRKLAACSLVSAAALLAACGQSQQQASAPPANPPAADASKDASKPADKSMSVAELTGQPSDANQAPNSSPPINAPADANAQPQQPLSQPPNTADRAASSTARSDGRPPTRSGALASADYVPHPSNAAPVVGPNDAPPPPPVYEGPIDETRFARVISVSQLTEPQRVCTNETVTERRPPGDRHQVAGTVIGAIAGGVIGHQFGRGTGRDLATVGGAVGGGAIGKEIQKSHQEGDVVTRTVQHCRTVTPGRDVTALYDVVYAYQGQNFHVKLDHDPGDRIPLPVRGIDIAALHRQ